MAKKNVLDGDLSEDRFLEIAKCTGHTSQFRVNFEVNNFLDRTVHVFDAGKTRHELSPRRNVRVGRCLIIKMDITVDGDSVKINADEDYIEDYFFTLHREIKGNCRYRIVKDSFVRPGVIKYSGYFVFDSKDLIRLDNHVRIPDCGLDLYVGEITQRVKGSQEDWMSRVTPDLVPTNGHRPSGVILNAVDPDYRYDKMFYCFGDQVFEIDIDRTQGEQAGIYVGVWNKIGDLDRPVARNMDFIKFEDAASGKNPLGFMIFASQVEAENSLKQPAAKTTAKEKAATEEKESDPWEEKEQRAKLSQTWVKIAGEFIKSVLPAVVKGVTFLVKLLVKTPVPV